MIDPNDERFTGFVFKIQANMDPRHRDRIAFVRVCSGKFERDMIGAQRAHRQRRAPCARDEALCRRARVARCRVRRRRGRPGQSRASSRSAIRSTRARRSSFRPIPAFAPEHFASVRSIDTSSYKSFGKGIAQLREEGAVQVFYPWGSTRTEPILGVVGELQFEVAKYRLESEYGVKTHFSTLPLTLALRVGGDPDAGIARATAVQREARRGLGRPAGRALRERMERAPRAGVESGADVSSRT